MSSQAQEKGARLDRLEKAATDYVEAEKKRIDQEVLILKAILDGRTGGAGVQRFTVGTVDAVAQNDLAFYLAET